jgi:hypothetical protein
VAPSVEPSIEPSIEPSVEPGPAIEETPQASSAPKATPVIEFKKLAHPQLAVVKVDPFPLLRSRTKARKRLPRFIAGRS